jgi:hypothetical protein
LSSNETYQDLDTVVRRTLELIAMYSPELETLDQLSGEDMPLAVIRQLFGNADHFRKAILAMLHEGDIALLSQDGGIVPQWEWKPLLNDPTRWPGKRLSLTDSGAKRI